MKANEFEIKLKKAKELLEKLNNVDITLSESIKTYQEGMKLLEEAQQILEKTKLEIEKI